MDALDATEEILRGTNDHNTTEQPIPPVKETVAAEPSSAHVSVDKGKKVMDAGNTTNET